MSSHPEGEGVGVCVAWGCWPGHGHNVLKILFIYTFIHKIILNLKEKVFLILKLFLETFI